MISEFEARLAAVLRGRVPAPFADRVHVAPGPASAAQAGVVLAVTRAEPLAPDWGLHARPEPTPGVTGRHPVARLGCDVHMDVRPSTAGGRAEAMRGVDALVWALAARELQDGTALLSQSGDPGFVIQRMELTEAVGLPAPPAPHAFVRARATGWFWPVGTPGEDGREIDRIRLRGALQPLQFEPARPRLRAGGEPVELTVRVPGWSMEIDDTGARPLPFGEVALFVADVGSTASGAGTISGGSAGADGARIAPLVDGAVTVTYTPPAAPARDELVVSVADGKGGQGVELARLALESRA